MPRSCSQLDLAERRKLDELLSRRFRVDDIAVELGHHRSAIYREIKRNRFVDREMPQLDGYYGKIAGSMAAERRARQAKLIRDDELRKAVIDRLEHGWSPEQIAGRLRIEPDAHARRCHETIYAWVYSSDAKELGLYRHLPRRRRKRRPRFARIGRSNTFPEARNISNRPDSVNDRNEFGHWECDLIQFRKEYGEANLSSVVERKTRFAVLLENADRRTKPVLNAMADALLPLPKEARRSFTFDQGVEFTGWRDFGTFLDADAWFCDPRAPWQKGAVENTNGRVRRYLPRKTNLAQIGSVVLPGVIEQLNATPRKCLGYRTPHEAF
ncbi:MAG: IS30 family transposase, partial [Paracoccaceae bacterium]